MDMDDKSEIIEMTADIVAAYVGHNSVAAGELASLIQSVHRALAGVSSWVTPTSTSRPGAGSLPTTAPATVTLASLAR